MRNIIQIFFLVTFLICMDHCIVHQKTTKTYKRDDFVKNVHIVFMNHLDVGYAGYIGDVINKYFTTYFPRAISLAYGLKKYGYVERFIYTTHPWLVSLYIDCPPNFILNDVTIKCPNSTEKTLFEAAVKDGCITWHAGPMNLQIEMADEWLFGAGLDISADLDRKFNIQRTLRVLSQRDVPGITEAAISILMKKGIAAVSVGVNNMTPPPAVPSLFIWKRGSNKIMATWHAGGYPDDPGPYPSNPGGLSRKDCVVMSEFSEALCFAFRTDNTGPPTSIQEILSYYEILRAEFPSATLLASTFDAYFSAVNKIKDHLPVVEGEIGDTWIQGVASDPRKCAEYRALSRILKSCVTIGKCAESDERLKNATRFLIKLPEHTWGLPTENDRLHWNNSEFHVLRNRSPNFVNCARSWLEQRDFIKLTVDALTGHPVVSDILRELDFLKPQQPVLAGFISIKDYKQMFQCHRGGIQSLKFGSDGSIVMLTFDGINWVDNDHSSSKFLYRTFNEKDFEEFRQVYNYGGGSPGFDKAGMQTAANPESKLWQFNVTGFFSNTAAECDFYLSIEPDDLRAVTHYGAPKTVWMRYTVRPISCNNTANPGIDITLQWFNKTTTRLAESLTLAFKIKPQDSYRWLLWKLNQAIDPGNVKLNGSQYQHVLDDNGAEYTGLSHSAFIQSFDVPIGSPIARGEEPHVFPAPLTPITKSLEGIAFNMYNNLWTTNYIMWYPYTDSDENFKARFSIAFLDKFPATAYKKT